MKDDAMVNLKLNISMNPYAYVLKILKNQLLSMNKNEILIIDLQIVVAS